MTRPPTTEAEGLREAIHAEIAACNRRFDETGYYEADQMLDAIMQLHQLETAKAVREARIECMQYAEELAEVNYGQKGAKLAVVFRKRLAELQKGREGVR